MIREAKVTAFDFLLVLAIVLTLIEVPLSLVFKAHSWSWSGLIEFFVCVVLAYDSYRIYLWNRAGLRTTPIWTWIGFGLNILAFIPVLAIFGQTPLRLLRLGLLWRLIPLNRLVIRVGVRRTRFPPAVFRLAAFAFWTLMLAHWMACGWVALGPEHVGGDTETYIRSLYWTMTTLATVGYGDIVPQTPIQMLYATIVMLIGTALYGYVIGSIASLIANLDLAQAHHDKKVEQVSAFLEYRRISPDIRERILNFYEYLWESRMGFNERSILSELPPSLRTELALYMNRNLIAKVPLFKQASEDFMREIVIALRPVVFAPGDVIIRCGEVGEEMYFINRGSVEILTPTGDLIAELHEGQYFGEIALITNSPRNATVMSSNYCDLYRLDRRMFDLVLKRYPEVAKQIHSMAKKRSTGRPISQIVENPLESAAELNSEESRDEEPGSKSESSIKS